MVSRNEYHRRRPALRELAARAAQKRFALGPTEPRPDGVEAQPSIDQEWFRAASQALPMMARTATVAAMRPGDGVDTERLVRAVCSVVGEHHGLHSTITHGATGPVLRPVSEAPTVLTGLEGGPHEAAELLTEPFDLDEGPLVRCAVTTVDGETFLVVAASRMALDRAGTAALLNAVAAAYHGVPPPPGLDFGDYGYWRRTTEGEVRFGERGDRLRDQLVSAAPARLPFHSDPFPGSAPVGGTVSLQVPTDTAAHLLSSFNARQREAAVFAAVYAALRRFGTRPDIGVGIRRSDRDGSARNLLGPVGTEVAALLRCDPNQSWSTGITEVENSLRRARVDPEAVVASLLADIGNHGEVKEPLLPLGLEMVELPAPRLGSSSLHPRLLPSPIPMHDIDIVAVVDPVQGGVELMAEYDIRRLDPRTAESLLQQTVRELAQIVAAPESLPARSLRVRPDTSRTSGTRPRIDRAPDSAALRRRRALLVGAGAGPGRALVVRARRCAESALTLRAALTTGADVVPVENPDTPWERSLLQAVTTHYTDAVVEVNSEGEAERPLPVRPGTAEFGAWIVALRSGTEPRLLRVPVPELERAAAVRAQVTGAGAGDRLLHSTAWTSEEAAIRLLMDASRVPVVSPVGASGVELFDLICANGVTMAQLTPEALESVPLHLSEVGVRTERLRPGSETEAVPSECTVVSQWWVAEAPASLLVSVDGDAPRTRGDAALVLGPEMVPVLPGGVGTLFVTAPVDGGYLTDPRTTAERYLPDPRSTAGGRIVSTGALVRSAHDGSIVPVEVPPERVHQDDVSVDLDAVRDAYAEGTTLGVGVQEWGWRDPETPFAVARTEPGEHPVTPREGGLPEGIRPRTVPLSDHGGRPVSPRTHAERAFLPRTTNYIPPATETERRLTELILTPLLGLSEIGRHTSMFELGGGSLQVVQTVARTRNLFDVDVALSRLFNEPTLACLGALVDDALSDHRTAAEVLDEIEGLSPHPADVDTHD